MKSLLAAALIISLASCSPLPAWALPEYADPRVNPTLALTWANPGGDHAHHCSGFYIGDGQIVTAAHCVYDGDNENFYNQKFAVHDRLARFIGFTRKVLFVDPVHDIAVIAGGDDDRIRPAKVLCSPPDKGTIVRVTGYPQYRWYIETFGVVTSGLLHRDGEWSTYVLNNAVIDHGSSGGPVWDAAENAVVGVAVGTLNWQPVLIPTSVLCAEYLATK